MKFTAKKDIEATAAQVWDILTDFEAWERAAMRRGAEVERTDTLRSAGPGMAWRAKAAFRGKPREVDVQLTEMATPAALGFAAQSNALGGVVRVEVMEMSAKRTRLHIALEISPRNLGARLFLQSLRLARARVDRKFETRVSQFAQEIEQRCRSGARRA